MEAHQIEHIEHQRRKGTQDAVHGHQLIPLAAPDKLGAEGAQAAHQDIEVNEEAVLRHIGQELRHRPAEHQQAEAAQNGQQAIGEHLLFAVALIQTKADDGVGHSHRNKGDQQVGILAQDLGQTEVGDLGHGVGQKRLDDQRQQLRREAGDRKDQGVSGQLAVFVRAGSIFVRQGYFPSLFIIVPRKGFPFKGKLPANPFADS